MPLNSAAADEEARLSPRVPHDDRPRIEDGGDRADALGKLFDKEIGRVDVIARLLRARLPDRGQSS